MFQTCWKQSLTGGVWGGKGYENLPCNMLGQAFLVFASPPTPASPGSSRREPGLVPAQETLETSQCCLDSLALGFVSVLGQIFSRGVCFQKHTRKETHCNIFSFVVSSRSISHTTSQQMMTPVLPHNLKGSEKRMGSMLLSFLTLPCLSLCVLSYYSCTKHRGPKKETLPPPPVSRKQKMPFLTLN